MSTILVIDDDDLFRQFLGVLLERAGFAVSMLAGGARLGETLRSEPIDVIVTDLFMPDVDGIEILLTAKREAPGIPVIGMTGGRSDGMENPCIAAMVRLGAAAVIRKPIDRHELLSLLYRLLGRGPYLTPVKGGEKSAE